MGAVVEYLQSIHWASSEIPLDIATQKLTALVKDLEIICRSAQPAKQRLSTANKPGTQSSSSGNAPKRRVNQMFTRVVPKKKMRAPGREPTSESDNDYQPRPPRDVSEELEDDFDLEEIENPNSPVAGRKRKILVVDDGSNEQGKPKKKSKSKKAATSDVPKVSVIEIESEDERPEAKRGPSSTSRDHFHPPAAVTSGQDKCWEFKCRHCKT
ncbi:hypothetical protein DFH06DRAFT_464116 [Mycena polygramma]|nr:hypothetical protein DFH06DRAFT_464116 [Mycena polygramma]